MQPTSSVSPAWKKYGIAAVGVAGGEGEGEEEEVEEDEEEEEEDAETLAKRCGRK